MSGNQTSLSDKIIEEAHRLGFDLVGVGPAAPPITAKRYRTWLEKGYHGEMAYLARPDAVIKRSDPAHILTGIRSIVTVGVNYHTTPLPPELRSEPSRGIIASYAWGDDYHEVLTPHLHQLGEFVAAQTGESVAYRAYVDTGPLLERELAARAGVGFVGKNTNLIHPCLGSWLFLGELLLDVELPPQSTSVEQGLSPGATENAIENLARHGNKGTCGQCTRCLDACPTEAFAAPYVLDARHCISYLTIELKGPIPRELRPLMRNRVFGCDICQEVCPWNRRFAQPTMEPAFQPRPDSLALPLLDLMALDEEGFRQRFRGSPIKRARRRGLLRNVAVALGNWGDPVATPVLARALGDDERLIRGHAAWALGRIATQEARHALAQALTAESDEWVREEIETGLTNRYQASPV